MAVVNLINTISDHVANGASSIAVGYLCAKAVTLISKTAISGYAGAVWGASTYLVSQVVDPVFKKLQNIAGLSRTAKNVLTVMRGGISLAGGYFLTNLVTPISLKGIVSLGIASTAGATVAVVATATVGVAGLALIFGLAAHGNAQGMRSRR
jgi:hypothetical protein